VASLRDSGQFSRTHPGLPPRAFLSRRCAAGPARRAQIRRGLSGCAFGPRRAALDRTRSTPPRHARSRSGQANEGGCPYMGLLGAQFVVIPRSRRRICFFFAACKQQVPPCSLRSRVGMTKTFFIERPVELRSTGPVRLLLAMRGVAQGRHTGAGVPTWVVMIFSCCGRRIGARRGRRPRGRRCRGIDGP